MLFKQIFIALFFLVISLASYGQEESQTDYASVIKQADAYFNSGDYIKAKTSYQYASRLRPSDTYAKEKLQETISKLRDRMVVMEQYTSVISQADDYYRSGDYDQAREKYKEAAKIVPSEGYPAEQLKEIENREAEVRKKQVAYDDAVYRAEKYEKYNRFDEAIAEYEKALAVFPDKQEPKDRIAELNTKKVEFEKAVDAYDEIVTNADRLFGLKYYENARIEYEKAFQARPDEDYPQVKIKEIDKLLVKKKDYDILVDQADEMYMNKQLQKAKENYQAALKIYPAESYPKDMIEKINSSLQDKLGKDELYQQSVKQGDAFLAARDYTNALSEYQNASDLKPEESYPKNKIKEVNAIIDQQEADEQTYNLAIKNGDAYLNAQSYAAAKKEFETARSIKPDEPYPNEKLKAINKVLEDQQAVMDSYNASIEKADAFFNAKDYDQALAEYKNALIILPGDLTATEKIEEIKSIKKAEKDLDFEYTQLVADADALMAVKDFAGAREKYTTAKNLKPSETYPQEKLSEIEQKLTDQRELNNAYNKSMATADLYYNKGEYQQALTEYEKASQLKPSEQVPQDRIAEINLKLSEENKEIEEYNDILNQADNLFGLQQYEEAKKLYLKASYLNTRDQYPKTKLDELETILSEKAQNEQAFNKLVAAADRMMEDGEYQKAKERYIEALLVIPGSNYPTQKLKEIDDIEEANDRASLRAYNDVIEDADALFNAKDYEGARKKYLEAQESRPSATYPAVKLGEIAQMNEDYEKLQAQYMRIIAEADRLFTSKEYEEAKVKYMEAAAILPGEDHPKKRLEEINLVNRSQMEQSQQAYDKAVADADKFLASAVYDQALDSYRKARAILPDETYPDEMISRIMKILNDNAMRKLHSGSMILANNEVKKFTFNPIDFADRKNSILLIKVRNLEDSEFKVIMNYGIGGAKKGGVILPMNTEGDAQEFIIPLGKQYTWSSEGNNYISLTPQGGGIELLVMEISKGN
ncbi:MAG: tetratricopeptide repeat protein [Bacteroidetes bacterium]|nr:tetratricopeptide repeat protein [Bacteroidota bacterium]